MLMRRLVFLAIAVATVIVMTILMLRVLAPGGWTAVKLLLLACFLCAVPWLGLCFGNAILGFATLVLARNPPRAVLFVAGDLDFAPITARTALAMTVRNEDLAALLPPLQRLRDSLAAHGDRFAVFVLSDTQDPDLAAAELDVISRYPAIIYRRRTDNTGFKAGNVMDFLDHHADGFDLAVTLDADSQMTGDAVLRLVRIMQADPRVGLVQHLTVGAPAEAAFPRLFQFGMRAGMRVWATGQAWWQGDEGPYWGHNAIFRIAPFREHARLGSLPDGSTILSHDQVEAALLRAAGWRVCMWAGEDGSMEQNPPALPEFLSRDSRWMAGNLQYFALLRSLKLRPMGRWQLVQAILLFLSMPLYPAMLVLAVINGATHGADVPRDHLLMLALVWPVVIYSPKLLGYVEILVSRTRAGRYGGEWRFALGALGEILFTLLLDAVVAPSKLGAMGRVLTGRSPGWLPQNRSGRGVPWREAGLRFWSTTLFGLVLFAALFSISTWAALLAMPFAGGLLLAIPFAVVTSSLWLSRLLQSHAVAATPEECDDR